MTLPDRMRAAADDPNIVIGADGLLAVFNDAGVLAPLDVLSAMTIGRVEGEDDPEVLLAAALAVRGTRYGHVCISLGSQRDAVFVDGQEAVATDLLPWPELDRVDYWPTTPASRATPAAVRWMSGQRPSVSSARRISVRGSRSS